MKFFYVEPGTDDAVLKAFRKCGEILKSSSCLDIGLVVPQLGNLEGLISDCLGDEAIKELRKNKAIKLTPETIRLFTRRRPPKFFKGPLLLAFVPTDQVESVIKACPGADIVFIPWAVSERDEFVKKHNPELI